MGKKSRKVLVALYVFFILWGTIFSREPGTARIVKGLFWEVRMGYWWDIALNILLFIPFGSLLGRKGWKAVLFGFLLSAFIECAQYLFLLGYCEADDVLNNTLGTAVGVAFYKVLIPLFCEDRKMYSQFLKRLFDFLIGLIALPFLLVIIIIMTPIIYFDDKGPVFYNAPRLGKNGKPFKMFKFRSMMVNAPDIRNEDGSTYNGDDDPRVTKVGRFMRKTSIDELPQLLNVLIGDMSLIGPRPDPLDDMEIYTEHQKKKLVVRPGITGYNQAYYRNSVEQNEKFEHDVYYAEHISFILDVKIFFKTIATVLSHDNVYNDASGLSEEEKKKVENMRDANV